MYTLVGDRLVLSGVDPVHQRAGHRYPNDCPSLKHTRLLIASYTGVVIPDMLPLQALVAF